MDFKNLLIIIKHYSLKSYTDLLNKLKFLYFQINLLMIDSSIFMN